MSKLTKTPKIEIVFDCDIDLLEEKYIKKDIASSIKNISKYFLSSPKLITIYLFKNRTNFLKSIGRVSTPEWLMAIVPPKSNSIIYIYLDEQMKKKFPRLITHEITHLYSNIYNKNLPDWIKEGISVYIAEQIFNTAISINDWKKVAPKGIPFYGVPWQSAIKYGGYNIAGLLVLFFKRKFGWEEFLKSVRQYKPKHSIFKTIASHLNKNTKDLIKEFEQDFIKK